MSTPDPTPVHQVLLQRLTPFDRAFLLSVGYTQSGLSESGVRDLLKGLATLEQTRVAGLRLSGMSFIQFKPEERLWTLTRSGRSAFRVLAESTGLEAKPEAELSRFQMIIRQCLESLDVEEAELQSQILLRKAIVFQGSDPSERSLEDWVTFHLREFAVELQ